MVNIDDAVICRLKRGDKEFEILVDPNKALDFKKGKKINLDEILAVSGIYYDVRKSESISNEELQKNFGTTDAIKIASIVLEKGELLKVLRHVLLPK